MANPSDNPPQSGAASKVKPRIAWRIAVLLIGVVCLFVGQRWARDRGGSNRASHVQDPSETVLLPSRRVEISEDQMRQEFEQTASDLLSNFPQSASALDIVASEYFQLRQWQRATELWTRASQLAPNFVAPRVGLAMIQIESGQSDVAVEMLQLCREAQLTSQAWYLQYARALQIADQTEGAIDIATEGVSKYPGDGALWVMLGQLQFLAGDLKSAQECYQHAMALSQDNHPQQAETTQLHELGDALNDQEKAAKLRATLQSYATGRDHGSSPPQAPGEAAIRRILVDTLVKSGHEFALHQNTQKAQDLYLRALEIDPDEPTAYQGLAILWRHQNRWEDIYNVQLRLMQLRPQNVIDRLNYAAIAQQTGRMDEAERAFVAAQQESPDSPLVQQSLVLFYLSTDRLIEARKQSQRLIQLDPSPDSYKLSAIICRRLGDDNAATQAEQQAEKMEKESESANRSVPSR